ncbi:MAG: hypothetical protein EPO08_21260 [Rhodospirillaceae bacterium]|nr:MAG: hypothetical protein EPO08_21260 [Rhodospirillaceae bacterium]
MGTFKVISKEIKEQVLARIKNDGATVTQVAKDAGISTKTVYNWLTKGATPNGEVLENRRLKKEVEGLYALVGKLTAELEKTKKKNIAW